MWPAPERTPRWFLATLLVPETTTEKDAEGIFDQIQDACALLGATLVGGHSEVTRSVGRPVVVGCMLGEVEKGKLVHTGGAVDGDSIVVTKGIALEGTSLLARDAAETLSDSGVTGETLSRARDLLFTPGISVVKDALVACSAVRVHSLHDPTEGGLATALWEVAHAAGVGLAVEEGSIPVLPECAEVCQALDLSPLGLLASGALLVTLPPEDVPRLVTTLDGGGDRGIRDWPGDRARGGRPNYPRPRAGAPAPLRAGRAGTLLRPVDIPMESEGHTYPIYGRLDTKQTRGCVFARCFTYPMVSAHISEIGRLNTSHCS